MVRVAFSNAPVRTSDIAALKPVKNSPLTLSHPTHTSTHEISLRPRRVCVSLHTWLLPPSIPSCPLSSPLQAAQGKGSDSATVRFYEDSTAGFQV